MSSSAGPVLIPRAAFAGLKIPCSQGQGVMLHDRDGLGIANVLVRKGKREELALRLRERLGIELPQGPRRAAAGDFSLLGIGPEAWWAIGEQGGNSFAPQLRKAAGDLASISEQTDGHAILRLSGPRVRDALAKLLPIDLHPRIFGVGHVASTVAAHMGVTLWRLDDVDDGVPVFEAAVFRSLTVDFWHLLTENAAEFGVVVA